MVNLIKYQISYNCILLSIHKRGLFHSKWLMTVTNTLSDNGFEHIWDSHSNIPLNNSKEIKLKLIEKYKETWEEIIYVTPKCIYIYNREVLKYSTFRPCYCFLSF